MKTIGFLSFGHWSPLAAFGHALVRGCPSPSIDLAVAPRSSARTAPISGSTTSPGSSPRPSAAGGRVVARTRRIEIGTGVIDMRYENPLYMAEDAGSPISSPAGACSSASAAARPSRYRRLAAFRPRAAAGRERCRHGPAPHGDVPGGAEGRGLRRAEPRARCFPTRPVSCGWSRIRTPLRDRIWWGFGLRRHRRQGGRTGDEPPEHPPSRRRDGRAVPRSSTPADPRLPGGLGEGRARAHAAGVGVALDLRDRQRLDRAPIRRRHLARPGGRHRQHCAPCSDVPTPPSRQARGGTGARDEAIQEADTLLLTVPTSSASPTTPCDRGVLTHVAPALGWR